MFSVFVSDNQAVIDSMPGGAIDIIHGGDEAVASDDRDGVQRRETNRKLRWLLGRKITPRYQTLEQGFDSDLEVGGTKAPPAEIYWRGFNT